MSDERFRIAYNAKLADWGEPAWVWHPTPIVDWDETGRFFNNMITDPNERLEDSWEFVRILAINTSQTLFAQRVRYPRYRIGDGSVFDDTEKLDGQDDADYAKVKFEQDGIESVASPIVYKYKRGGRWRHFPQRKRRNAPGLVSKDWFPDWEDCVGRSYPGRFIS